MPPVKLNSFIVRRVCFEWARTASEDSVKNVAIRVYTPDGLVEFPSVDSCFTFILPDSAEYVRMDFTFDDDILSNRYIPTNKLGFRWGFEIDRDPVSEFHRSLMREGASIYFEISFGWTVLMDSQ